MTISFLNVHDSLAMSWRGLRIASRQIDSLLLAVILPVFLMLLFVFVFGGAMATDVSYVNYVVPGVIVLCAGFRAAGTAVGVAIDMERGVIDRFRSMPIASASVLVGHVATSLLVNLVAIAVVVVVAFICGFRPEAGLLDWILAGALLTLFVLAISWVSTALGLLLGNAEAANGATFFMLFLPYLSSAFVPVETMPVALQVVAAHQPYTPLIDSLRGLLLGTPVDSSGWLAGLWFGAIAIAGFAWSVHLFNRESRR
jgi:ABC-2 type transport system permease protein